MFDIKTIQRDILYCLTSYTTVPVYFYVPQQHPKTYIQINSTKISEHAGIGNNIANVELKITVKSESKSSKECLDIMDSILDLHQAGKIKFSTFSILQVGETERTLTICHENHWLGELLLYFWIEIAN